VTSPGFLAPVWEAAGRGRLVVQHCRRCDHRQWTPQPACRSCLSEELGWSECSGRGRIYSVTVVHRSPDPARFSVPYVLAIVALDEGPHLLARLRADPDRPPRIGDPVRVVFRTGGPSDPGACVYEFEPA
jgi:uncharacterized OB-fold protein